MKNTNKLAIIFTTITPVFASAAAFDGIKGIISQFSGLINPVIALLAGLAIVYFFWGIAQFVLKDAGNDKTREDGKKKIMWGVIALFVLFSIFGIINWLQAIIGVNQGANVLPSHPLNGQGYTNTPGGNVLPSYPINGQGYTNTP